MPSHPVDVHVGKRLRMRRTMLNLSQDEMAKEIGLTFQQIQKYEQGVNRLAASRLYELSYLLGVSVDYFFEGFEGGEQEHKARTLNSRESLQLIRAYCRIKEKDLRQEIMKLIHLLAEKKSD